MMAFDQSGFEVRFEWGLDGAVELSRACDALVVVDVMSFTTCVTMAVRRGAIVFAARGRDADTLSLASSVGATVAGPRSSSGFSLSPASFLTVAAGARIVLPSPNGSTIVLATGSTPTLAGCLRNARSVALAAMRYGPRVGVVAAGERWKQSGTLRPAFEDLVGAGAIVTHLRGSWSPEARAAAAAFRDAANDLAGLIAECASGRELRAMGFARDLELIAALDVDDVAPVLVDGAFVSSGDDGHRRDPGRRQNET
jgi:2-phosphosulfolactate phosphatase